MSRPAYLALVLLSCGTNGPPAEALVTVPDTPPTIALEVGTGEETFQPLADGDPVPLVFGPQGGFHVWTGIRVNDASLAHAPVNLFARHEDGTAAGPPSRSIAVFSPTPDGARAAAGLRTLVDAPAAPGRRIVLRVELVASDQRHGVAEQVVVAQ